MPKTKLEKAIRHERGREGVLVPLLEDFLQEPLEIEDEEDIQFVIDVLTSQVARSQARIERPLFSPSQLAECLRYVYLLKHHKELGIERVKVKSASAHFYFFNGNFLHLKWQFALFKLDRALPDDVFKLFGVEIPIVSKRGDHGGTVDALCAIYQLPYIVDFKGLNVRAFSNITRGEIPPQYAMQLSDYGMLFNASTALKKAKRKHGASAETKLHRGLLVTESKGGPDPKHPIALHETEIEIETFLPEVKRRLTKLRKHGEENSIPKAECQSTGSVQFLGCPFRKFCKEEVQRNARRKRKADREDTAKLTVAVPRGRRSNRAGGNSGRRGSRST